MTIKLNEIRRLKDIFPNRFQKGNSHQYQKRIWHACVDCEKERWVVIEKGKPKSLRCRSCGLKASIMAHPRKWQFRGGRIITTGGYIYVRIPRDDFFYPMVIKSHGYVLEHRLVMARYLKRCLLPWEIVHHKDGNKVNNNINNLMLLPSAQYHLVDHVIKSYVHRLESKITKQTEQIKLLTWHINELEKTQLTKERII